ncbi:glycosyltransferase [Jatrophihabitans fulvus]
MGVRHRLDRVLTPGVRDAARARLESHPRLENAVRRVVDRRKSSDRLVELYDNLQQRYGTFAADRTGDALPSVADIAEVEKAALAAAPRKRDVPWLPESFYSTLFATGSLGRAAVTGIERLLDTDQLGHARTVAMYFRVHPRTRLIGDACQSVLETRAGGADLAWGLVAGHGPADVLAVMPPHLYFRAGFRSDPERAAALLGEVRDGTLPLDTPTQWLDISRTSFSAGYEDLSRWALDRAEKAVKGTTPASRATRTEIAWLREWYGRAEAARTAPSAPSGEIAFGVLDYKQPDRHRSSINLGDPVQTLASLGHLARRRGVRFTAGEGADDITAFATELQGRVKPERVVEGDAATVRLYEVQRDASAYCAVPEGTWMLAFGWYMHNTFRMKFGLPFNPNIRPIFVSFHINNPSLLTDELIEYLRRYAPVGCRDWNTVYLLLAAGVPAFFSGCITTTIDTVFPPVADTHPQGRIFVDLAPDGPGDTYEQEFPAVRDRSITANLREAMEQTQGYRDRYETVVASRLHCYLPSRSIGANVDFRPKNPSNVRFDGLIGLSDAEFDAVRDGILAKLDTVLTAILAGKSEDDVYGIWRDACAADVAAAEEKLHGLGPIEPPAMDVAAACRQVRERATSIERTAPAPSGAEIDVEFSLDGNLKQQFAVVLDSVVRHASRPIRAHVLCRDHDETDYRRMAELFPTVSFHWLPTDDVDYGPVIAMIKHITVATMDRLLLPELLPEVPRIVHHDLDALCLADLAELADTDLQGHPLAARTSPHPSYLHQFFAWIRYAPRLAPERSREFIRRTHSRHRFDFDTFNAGVLVLDLDRMRADDFCRNFLPYVERFGQHDQGVLNIYAGPHRAELADVWNWHPRLEPADTLSAKPKIAHWAGPMKPWRREWVNGNDLWKAAEKRLLDRS